MPLDALQFIVYSRRKGLYVPINHTTVVAILLFSLIFFFPFKTPGEKQAWEMLGGLKRRTNGD